MARGVNKAIILGNCGADPETRFTSGGNAVTNLRVAASHGVKNKDTGEWGEETEWFRVVMFGKLAEIAGEHLAKGSQVYIEGRIQTRKWQDNDGNDRWTTEIIANEMRMCGNAGGQAPESEGGQGQQPPAGEEGLDDDIPFA